MSDRKPHGFRKEIARRMLDNLRGPHSDHGEVTEQIEQRRDAIVKVPSGGIPVMSGVTPGTALVQIVKYNGVDLEDMTVSEIGLNIDKGATVLEGYTTARREYATSQWVVDPQPITNLRLDGNNLQYMRAGVWYTWHTGTDCAT